MKRETMQTWALIAVVAALVLVIVRYYEAQVAMAPHNLEGNIAVDGGMTANAPAN